MIVYSTDESYKGRGKGTRYKSKGLKNRLWAKIEKRHPESYWIRLSCGLASKAILSDMVTLGYDSDKNILFISTDFNSNILALRITDKCSFINHITCTSFIDYSGLGDISGVYEADVIDGVVYIYLQKPTTTGYAKKHK